jgi:hypothetical protein
MPQKAATADTTILNVTYNVHTDVAYLELEGGWNQCPSVFGCKPPLLPATCCIRTSAMPHTHKLFQAAHIMAVESKPTTGMLKFTIALLDS